MEYIKPSFRFWLIENVGIYECYAKKYCRPHLKKWISSILHFYKKAIIEKNIYFVLIFIRCIKVIRLSDQLLLIHIKKLITEFLCMYSTHKIVLLFHISDKYDQI